jgi:glycosyltransferase involved in cell wall biosynthesis
LAGWCNGAGAEPLAQRPGDRELIRAPLPPISQPAVSDMRGNDGVVRLLSVGSVGPIKGYDLLIDAVATLVAMPWRLTIAGDRTRNPAAAARLDADIESHGLGSRVSVLGAVPPERIAKLFLASDIFVLASRFEGYGMALSEEIAHGFRS